MSGSIFNQGSSPPPRIVGTNHIGYPEERNFARLPLQRYEVRKQLDLFKLPTWFCYRLLNRNYPFLLNTFCDFGLVNRCALLHLFNGICLGGRPWVVTFETALPRWGWSAVPDWLVAHGVRLLAGSACRRVIALSRCAANIQMEFLRSKFQAFAPAVEAKMEVLHPSQPPLVQNGSGKPGPDQPIHFVMVGGDFFRKGGLEVLRVFDRLLNGDAPVRLTIVSRLRGGDYATHATPADEGAARDLIERHADRITWHFSMPNNEVLELMKSAHVGLLPTWADTYGYSVLEAQAAACPVISTDVRALPEINNNSVGWMIPVPKDADGNGRIATAQERGEFSKIVERGVEAAVRDILRNPNSVRIKGSLALERIRAFHDPCRAAERLEGIYDSILTVAT